MGFYEDFLNGLEKAARGQFKNPQQLAKFLQVEPNLISRWLNKDRVPSGKKMGQVLDALGAQLVFNVNSFSSVPYTVARTANAMAKQQEAATALHEEEHRGKRQIQLVYITKDTGTQLKKLKHIMHLEQEKQYALHHPHLVSLYQPHSDLFSRRTETKALCLDISTSIRPEPRSNVGANSQTGNTAYSEANAQTGLANYTETDAYSGANAQTGVASYTETDAYSGANAQTGVASYTETDAYSRLRPKRNKAATANNTSSSSSDYIQYIGSYAEYTPSLVEYTPSLKGNPLHPVSLQEGTTQSYTHATKDAHKFEHMIVDLASSGPPLLASKDIMNIPLLEEDSIITSFPLHFSPTKSFLLSKNMLAEKESAPLFALQLGEHSTAMSPKLNPHDILFFTKQQGLHYDAKEVYLVLHPAGHILVRRVHIEKLKPSKITRIFFYADNGQEHAPLMFHIEQDYPKHLAKHIILGKLVHRWTV